MRLHLEQLPHQEAAISAVLKAMENCLDETGSNPDANYVYANPVLNRMRGIDVKMETGTGKTYVYTRLMHELYQEFGINKFIIMTPNLAIKEGTKSFIASEYSRQHFRELFPSQKINLGVINSGDFTTKKGKRRQFAGSLTDYAEASRNDVGTVNVLLLNDDMLGSKSMWRHDYDQTLIGGVSQPVEALKLTRPIVIVDEPHRFKKDSKAWENILALNPQLIIRFGATFPDKVIGKGKSKVVKKDYDNLVYNLDAVKSFNQGLVKGIDVRYPELPKDQASVKYRVTSATSKEMTVRRDNREWTVNVGDDLSIIDPLFDGDVTYEGKRLSNELAIGVGSTLTPGIFSNGYQEMILRQAIDAHFEKERELFYRPANAPRIKVVSLYFIDSIASYREDDGWLKMTFERLLDEKLSKLIASEDGEYKDFLLATQKSLKSDNQKVHAGYFAEDSAKKGDEAIQEQVDDILKSKERLLPFKNDAGNWNTRRFLFSKWTLREGWDNPNVFVLTKLRSSGSESSKIQEVGRGLRLPFDELGNRVSDEEFYLDFHIDYSEEGFAEKLKSEINSDGGKVSEGKITDEVLELLVDNKYATDVNAAFFKLGADGIVDHDRNILKPDELDMLVPLGVKHGKIRENSKQKPVVRLRKSNWEKIRDMWRETSKRFMLAYDKLDDTEIESLAKIAITARSFSASKGEVKSKRLMYDDETEELKIIEQTIVLNHDYGNMPYGEFVKKIGKTTNLPANMIHAAVVDVAKNNSAIRSKFNEQTIQNITETFKKGFIDVYSQKYEYDALDFETSVSLFDKHGNFVDEISRGSVGDQIASDVNVADNYLYDEVLYESDLEHEILKVNPGSEVLVFGKLPTRSIKVPTYTGGTSSPDFVYAIRDKQTDRVKMYALIEAKGKDEVSKTGSELATLEAQKKFADKLEKIDIEVVNQASRVSEILSSITKE